MDLVTTLSFSEAYTFILCLFHCYSSYYISNYFGCNHFTPNNYTHILYSSGFPIPICTQTRGSFRRAMGQIRNVFKMFVGKSYDTTRKVLGVNTRIISIRISKKQAVRGQTCFVWLRTGTSGGLS
jgi:hypothetical protein